MKYALIAFMLSITGKANAKNSRESDTQIKPDTIREYKHSGVISFLGAHAILYTGAHPVHKYGFLKPEILFGNITETTLWYSLSFGLGKKKTVSLFTGPGISYSLDKGQGFRLRWQYGVSWSRISEKVPFSIFWLSNITYDFMAKQWTLAWYNLGISYPLSNRVSIQFSIEGHMNRGYSNLYTGTNIGFSFNY